MCVMFWFTSHSLLSSLPSSSFSLEFEKRWVTLMSFHLCLCYVTVFCVSQVADKICRIHHEWEKKKRVWILKSHPKLADNTLLLIGSEIVFTFKAIDAELRSWEWSILWTFCPSLCCICSSSRKQREGQWWRWLHSLVPNVCKINASDPDCFFSYTQLLLLPEDVAGDPQPEGDSVALSLRNCYNKTSLPSLHMYLCLPLESPSQISFSEMSDHVL